MTEKSPRKKNVQIFRGPEKSPRRKNVLARLVQGTKMFPQVRSHNTQIIQRACGRICSWAHAHAAGAMLTSEDRPETYSNVHSEDAEDGHTARFFWGPEKSPRKKTSLQIWSRTRKCPPPKWGLTNTQTQTTTLTVCACRQLYIMCQGSVNQYWCFSFVICKLFSYHSSVLLSDLSWPFARIHFISFVLWQRLTQVFFLQNFD